MLLKQDAVVVGILEKKDLFLNAFNEVLVKKYKLNTVFLSVDNLIYNMLIFSGVYPNNSYKKYSPDYLASIVSYYGIEIKNIKSWFENDKAFEVICEKLKSELKDKIIQDVNNKIYALKPFTDCIVLFDFDLSDIKRLHIDYLFAVNNYNKMTVFSGEPFELVEWLAKYITDPFSLDI